MALSSAVISFDIADLLGNDFNPAKTRVSVTTNVPDGVIADTVGNQIRVGDGVVQIGEDGTGTVSVWIPGTGSNPASWQTYIHLDATPSRSGVGRVPKAFGPFTITGDANLADLIAEQAVPPTYLSTVTALLDGYVDDAQAAAAAAVNISGISTSDGVVGALVAGTGGAGALTRAALATSIDAKTNQYAYIDFTTKPNGTPPSVMDTGQAVDYIFNATGRMPKISGGRLVVDPVGLTSGGVADYFQCDLGAPVGRIGTEWTQAAGADDGNGSMCSAAWASVYEGGGTNVPKSWIHMVTVAGTGTLGTAKWFVCDGIGHLFVVKQQTFKNPTADDVVKWRMEAQVDAEAGIAWATLPDDTQMTLTDAEIAAMCTTLGYAVVKFADLPSNVIMNEHFGTTGANAAKFPRFTSLYGETTTTNPKSFQSKYATPRAVARQVASLKASIPTGIVHKFYAPTTQMSIVSTTSAANVDTTNGKVTGIAGPSGEFVVVGFVYIEGSATDTVFCRIAGTVNSSTRSLGPVTSTSKGSLQYAIELTGLTPGQTIQATLQFWTVTNGSATAKAGGSGASMLPPLALTGISS